MTRRSAMTLAAAAAQLLLTGAALGQQPTDTPTAQKQQENPPAAKPSNEARAMAPAAVPASPRPSNEAPASEAATPETTQVPQNPNAAAAPPASNTPVTIVGASAVPMPLADAGSSEAPKAQPAPTRQDMPESQEQPPGPGEPLGSYQQHIEVMIGLRTSFMTDHDYRLFARTVDRLAESFPTAQLSLGAGGTLWKEQKLSVLLVGLWDYGGSSSDLRGEKTDLDVHRLALGAELRHHYFPWLYSMARLAPVAIDVRASLDDTASDTILYSRQWSFGFDVSVGAAAQLYGQPSAASVLPRLWAIGEVGYGWATPVDLTFKADDAAPQRMDEVSLGKLAIRGPMFRISAAMTFF